MTQPPPPEWNRPGWTPPVQPAPPQPPQPPGWPQPQPPQPPGWPQPQPPQPSGWPQPPQPSARRAAPPDPRRRARLVSGAVLAAVTVATAVVVFVLVRDSDDAPGSATPDAVVDSFAAALVAHDSGRTASLACSDTRTTVADSAANVVSLAVSASRAGSATVRGDTAAAAMSVTVHQTYQLPAPSGQVTTHSATPTVPATMSLKRVSGTWCVEQFSAPLPSY